MCQRCSAMGSLSPILAALLLGPQDTAETQTGRTGSGRIAGSDKQAWDQSAEEADRSCRQGGDVRTEQQAAAGAGERSQGRYPPPRLMPRALVVLEELVTPAPVIWQDSTDDVIVCHQGYLRDFRKQKDVHRSHPVFHYTVYNYYNASIKMGIIKWLNKLFSIKLTFLLVAVLQ